MSDRIRGHLAQIAHAFQSGEFAIPTFVHEEDSDVGPSAES